MEALLLARHGETDWNATGRFQGQTDVPLNAKGLAQAEALARSPRLRGVRTIYTSDLQRSLQSAQAVASALACPLIPDPRLRELNYGAWEGMTREEIAAAYPELWAQRLKDQNIMPPGAEALEDAAERLRGFLADLRTARPEGGVLVMTHGGLLSVLACVVTGLPLHRRFIFRTGNTGLCMLGLGEDSDGFVRLWNDTCHLDGDVDPWL